MNDDEQPTPRRTRAQLKTLVLEAAADLLRSEGLRAVPSSITYQRVFQYLADSKGIRITRGSVHERIWQSQEEFQLEALARVDPWNIAQNDSVLAPALAEFERTAGAHPFDRMMAMIRVAAPSTQTASETDPLYYAWVGMTMMLARELEPGDAQTERVAAAVRRANRETIERVGVAIRVLGETLGVRPRSDLFEEQEEGWRLVLQLGASLSEGATVRTRFDPGELPDVVMRTGPDGEAQEWTAFAAGYWALLHTFLEIDPEAHPDLVA